MYLWIWLLTNRSPATCDTIGTVGAECPVSAAYLRVVVRARGEAGGLVKFLSPVEKLAAEAVLAKRCSRNRVAVEKAVLDTPLVVNESKVGFRVRGKHRLMRAIGPTA